MTIPIWLLLAALAAVLAAVGIAYRSGYLMGAESAIADVHMPMTRRLGSELIDMIDDVERRQASAADVDTVRERRASDARTPGRIDSSGKAVLGDVER